MPGFTNFPAALQPLLQQNFLERELEEGLDSVLAYRREALQETIPARVGETLTRTRKGRKAPVSAPLDPTQNTGLDNGMTPSSFAVEQYSFSMASYGDTVDTNLMQELAGIADELIANSRNNGVQAAQSLERICRQKLFNAYLGGNTRATANGTTTTVHVDDIRGFTIAVSNGQIVPVSPSHTLEVLEVATASGGVSQTLTVTAALADGSNTSTVPEGISGTLTFSTATAPVAGDALVAANAPKILRPFDRLHTGLLTNSDVMSLALVQDAVAYLRDNGVPSMSDGTYHCILDNTSMRQLFADQDFKLAYASRFQSPEFQNADITRLLGVTYIPTTEAYLQAKNPSAGVNVKVRRPIVMGAESIIQGNFEGLEMWLEREGVEPISRVMVMNGVAQVVRPPIDRSSENVSLTWKWIGDFSCPTDMTATTQVIPTASNAMFRRAAIIEHAG